MVSLMVTTSVSMSNLFLFCYFGKLGTESYEMMADCIYLYMNWHELPIGLQKYFILMLANMQEPLYYQGFGVTKSRLELETFIGVIGAIFSTIHFHSVAWNRTNFLWTLQIIIFFCLYNFHFSY